MTNKGTKKSLVVDGVRYISSTKTHSRRGIVVLTLYLEGNTRTFFRLHFREKESQDLVAGDFAGCALDTKSGFGENLNRPGAIVAIIKKALAEGWAPSSDAKPTEIRDGIGWIKTIDFPDDTESVER